MSERAKGLTVALSEDLREEDLDKLREAISMLKGVEAVTPIPLDPRDWLARARIRRELSEKLWTALRE
jgi:hypothetical protein